MSVFTNPSSRSIEQARDYTTAILDLLGSREPMDVLTRTADAVRTAMARVSEAQLSQPESPGKWSMRHVVQRALPPQTEAWGMPFSRNVSSTVAPGSMGTVRPLE